MLQPPPGISLRRYRARLAGLPHETNPAFDFTGRLGNARPGGFREGIQCDALPVLLTHSAAARRPSATWVPRMRCRVLAPPVLQPPALQLPPRLPTRPPPWARQPCRRRPCWRRPWAPRHNESVKDAVADANQRNGAPDQRVAVHMPAARRTEVDRRPGLRRNGALRAQPARTGLANISRQRVRPRPELRRPRP